MIQQSTPSKKTSTVSIKEPEPELPAVEYNNKTELSYTKKGLAVPDRLDYQIKNFLGQVDETKTPIEKKINTIVRIMAVDYNDKQKKQKEFMYWYENWYGKNWQGQSIPPVTDHIEGIYQEQDTEPIIEQNRKTGDRRVGQHDVYYIPFSKEKVDELVESSVGSEKDTIQYIVKTPTMRNGGYTYEQFTSSTFPEAVQMMLKNGGPQLIAMEQQAKAQTKQEEKKQEVESKPTTTTASTPKPPQQFPPTNTKFPQK